MLTGHNTLTTISWLIQPKRKVSDCVDGCFVFIYKTICQHDDSPLLIAPQGTQVRTQKSRDHVNSLWAEHPHHTIQFMIAKKETWLPIHIKYWLMSHVHCTGHISMIFWTYCVHNYIKKMHQKSLPTESLERKSTRTRMLMNSLS